MHCDQDVVYCSACRLRRSMRRVGRVIWFIVGPVARRAPCNEASRFNYVSADHCKPERILKLLGLKNLAFSVRDLRLFRLLLPIFLLMPSLVQAQTAPPPLADIQRERVEQLKELLRTKKDLQASQQAMQQQLAEFDARIAAL